jgi:hypothetical protein
VEHNGILSLDTLGQHNGSICECMALALQRNGMLYSSMAPYGNILPNNLFGKLDLHMDDQLGSKHFEQLLDSKHFEQLLDSMLILYCQHCSLFHMPYQHMMLVPLEGRKKLRLVVIIFS